MASRDLTLDELTSLGMDAALAAELLERVNACLTSLSDVDAWQEISRHVLEPEHPFEVHRLLYDRVYADWETHRGPAPAWYPTDEVLSRANITRLMAELELERYEHLLAWSSDNRSAFWDLMVRKLGIRFQREPDRIADLSKGGEFPQWLPGAELNIVESCFRADADGAAIVYQAEGGPISTVSYGELARLTNRVANGLVDAGFGKGDAIAIDMPMTAESVAIYLGIVAAGCVAVSIADSFAAHEIQMRLHLSGARAIFTQDFIPRGGKRLPLYERVAAADAPRAIVLPCDGGALAIQLREGDLTWEAFLGDREAFDPVSCLPDDATNILFSSGTTGEPKAIPWSQTTPIKCAVDGYLHHDIQRGDVVAWPTNLGWMMGPWLIYASLINRATIGLYYGAPTGRDFGTFVQDAGVTMLGLVPSLVRAWRDSGCMKGLDWRALKAFSSTGECSNAEDMLFLMSLAGYRPVIEYCGGTEIGGGYITGTVVQPAAPATFSTPSLGLDLLILDEEGQPADNGEVFIVPPSIGLSLELLNRDHHVEYFEDTPTMPGGAASAPVLRRHGDQIERLGAGFYRAHGRVDDTMNLGGIKVSSAGIERVLNGVEDVLETAAIGVAREGGGPSRLVVYAVLLCDRRDTIDELKSAMQEAIKQDLNPLFRIHDVVVVDALPRTASNKVMRRVLRDRYGGTASGGAGE